MKETLMIEKDKSLNQPKKMTLKSTKPNQRTQPDKRLAADIETQMVDRVRMAVPAKNVKKIRKSD